MKKFFILTGWLLALAAMAGDSPSIYHDGWIDLDKNGKKDIYEDSSQPIQKRVNDLLKRMTLDEKIGQLWQSDTPANADQIMADKLRRGQVSSFLGGSAVIETPVLRNKLQHFTLT